MTNETTISVDSIFRVYFKNNPETFLSAKEIGVVQPRLMFYVIDKGNQDIILFQEETLEKIALRMIGM